MSRALIGIVSDTHGLVRPEALDALRGVDMILHGGDIGKAEVLSELEKIAPVAAVRGNNDRDEWASRIPETASLEIDGLSLFMIHDIKTLKGEPTDHDVIVFGHSHKPLVEDRSGVLYINPGSAGPRRFKLPVTVARLAIENAAASAEIIELSV